MQSKAKWLLLPVVGILLTTWIAVGRQTSVRKVDDNVLKNAAKGTEWLTYGQSWSEQRYSTMTQITPQNIGKLSLTWSYEVGPGGGKQEATPLFADGVMYVITNWSITSAIDARTGKELWRWDPEVNQATVRPKICCGIVNRGLAIYENLIISAALDGRLIALDMATGKPVWETRHVWSQDSYTVTMAPRIAKGKVIIGAGGAEYPVRGLVAAYDAKTGKEAWRFYTVPGDPKKGFESKALEVAEKTWDGEWWKIAGGGGTVWDAALYDPTTDLLYFGTGNPTPWNSRARTPSVGEKLSIWPRKASACSADVPRTPTRRALSTPGWRAGTGAGSRAAARVRGCMASRLQVGATQAARRPPVGTPVVIRED